LPPAAQMTPRSGRFGASSPRTRAGACAFTDRGRRSRRRLKEPLRSPLGPSRERRRAAQGSTAGSALWLGPQARAPEQRGRSTPRAMAGATSCRPPGRAGPPGLPGPGPPGGRGRRDAEQFGGAGLRRDAPRERRIRAAEGTPCPARRDPRLRVSRSVAVLDEHAMSCGAGAARDERARDGGAQGGGRRGALREDEGELPLVLDEHEQFAPERAGADREKTPLGRAPVDLPVVTLAPWPRAGLLGLVVREGQEPVDVDQDARGPQRFEVGPDALILPGAPTRPMACRPWGLAAPGARARRSRAPGDHALIASSRGASQYAQKASLLSVIARAPSRLHGSNRRRIAGGTGVIGPIESPGDFREGSTQ
jgi:hypothetical protein